MTTSDQPVEPVTSVTCPNCLEVIDVPASVPSPVSPDLTKLLERFQSIAEHLSIARLSMSMGAVQSGEKELAAARTAIEEAFARLEAQVTELSRIERELLQSNQDAMDFYEAELARLTALNSGLLKRCVELERFINNPQVGDVIETTRRAALPTESPPENK